MSTSYFERFQTYFAREVAQKAAHSLADGIEVEIKAGEEVLTFTKVAGQNTVLPSPAKSPQVIFTLTSQATEEVLSDSAQDIGSIGVGILKLLISSDANRRATVQLKTGFLTLFGKGYFGVLKEGGTQFASFLASRGLSSMGALKDAIKKMKQ